MELEAKYVSSFVYVLQIYFINKSDCVNNLCSCVEPKTQTQDTEWCLSFKPHMEGKAMTLAYEDLCDKRTKERRQKEAPHTA